MSYLLRRYLAGICLTSKGVTSEVASSDLGALLQRGAIALKRQETTGVHQNHDTGRAANQSSATSASATLRLTQHSRSLRQEMPLSVNASRTCRDQCIYYLGDPRAALGRHAPLQEGCECIGG